MGRLLGTHGACPRTGRFPLLPASQEAYRLDGHIELLRAWVGPTPPPRVQSFTHQTLPGGRLGAAEHYVNRVVPGHKLA